MPENGITIQISFEGGIESFLPKLAEFFDKFSEYTEPNNRLISEGHEILTADELAELWKVPKSKIYALTMQTGPESIPRFKIGRDLRFKRSDVMVWAEKQQKLNQ